MLNNSCSYSLMINNDCSYPLKINNSCSGHGIQKWTQDYPESFQARRLLTTLVTKDCICFRR